MLLIQTRERVRVLRLNRPAKRNALDTELTQLLYDALRDADADDTVRALVLTGEGRAFCAGADVGEFAALRGPDSQAAQDRARLTASLHQLLPELSKPIVSAVRGAAMGGGAGLAIGCDMLVAGTDLSLGYPELRHSLVPAVVMTSLQRQVGRKAAFELISTGRRLDAREAKALGLVNRVADPEAVVEVALEIADGWAAVAPAAMSATKRLFYQVADLPFPEAMRAGRDVNMLMRRFGEAGG